MIQSIVRFSLRFRWLITALACALVVYGIYTVKRLRYNVFPEFAPPQVAIQTEAPSLAPEQVEALVTQPIESAINGVSNIDSLRSQSVQGLSVITVIFHPGSDIYRDRQVVAERLAAAAPELPAGIQPRMTPLVSSTGTVLAVGLTSPTLSLMDLRTIADWTVKRRLLAVPGVAHVAVFGGEVRQIQVQFEPERLVRYGLSVTDVVAAAHRATGVRGAGFVTTPNQRIVLETQGQSLTPEQVASTVVAHHNGVNVTLADVSTVASAPAPRIGAASVMGEPAVILMVDSQFGANALEITDSLDRALSILRPGLAAKGVLLHTDIFRPANFIEIALHNVSTSLVAGAVLIVVVLFLFLFSLRTAAISCAAIPLSLLAAVVAIQKMGLNLNTMTLGGLAIAIGEVVDDAVIDVENIHRRLRENRKREVPRPAFRVILDASVEVRSAVVYASFAVILVFFPVLTLSGLAGRIFSPLGLAYIWAILASLAVALTVTPALCFLLLARGDPPPADPFAVRWLKRGYARALAGVERAPRLVLVGVVLVIVAGASTLPYLEGEFLPELRENHYIVHVWQVPGTSLDQSMRVGRLITQALLKLPYVRTVAQRAGRAEAYEDTWGTHYSEMEVDLKPLQGDRSERAEAAIRKVLAGFPGVSSSMETFLSERIEETLSGYTAGIAVNVFGDNLDAIDAEASAINAVLRKVPGAADVQLQSPPGAPQVVVRLRPASVARWGLDPADVLDAVRTAYGGDVVGQVFDGNRVFDVAVILDPTDRDRVAQIGDLPLRGPDGNYVPLRDLADIRESSGRYMIQHEGARRVATVTCDVRGRDLASFAADAQRRVSRLRPVPGTYVEFSGIAAAEAQSHRDLIVHSLFAGFGIVLLLAIVMRNYRNLLLVLANLPFALVGGVFAAALTGGILSLGSLVGFVTLFGITLRNSIMLISHYEHLVESEGVSWGLEAAMRGASERLAPILMTALVTGLGLLPLALGSGDPGREIEGPMAIVILGGLVTSTVLNLVVLPALALRYGRFEKPEPALE